LLCSNVATVKHLDSESAVAKLQQTVDFVKSQPVVVVVIVVVVVVAVVVVVVVVIVQASSCRCLPLIQTRHDIPPSSVRTTRNHC